MELLWLDYGCEETLGMNDTESIIEEKYSLVEWNGRQAIRVDTQYGWSIHLSWQKGDNELDSNPHCQYVEGKCLLAYVSYKPAGEDGEDGSHITS